MHTLGIDFGNEAIGLAVVDQSTNTVCELLELELRTDIRDRMEERRALRRFRRQRKRYRSPVEPGREGGKLAAPPYHKADGQNRSNLIKCIHVDPETGRRCAHNAPLKTKVRQELLDITLADLDIPDRLKADFGTVFKTDAPHGRIPSVLLGELAARRVHPDIIHRVGILLNSPLPGRSNYCREHIHLYSRHGDWMRERHAMEISNSVLARHDALVSSLRKLSRKYTITRIVIEDANFNSALITSGRLLDYDPEAKETGFLRKNTFKAMQFEYFNRCCYCGKDGATTLLEIDHVIPKSIGGANLWENLALCCRDCNSEKGWRRPEDAGMSFHVLEGVVVAGVPRRVELRPTSFEQSRSFKYISRTATGKRVLRNRIAETFPDAELVLDYGYRTAFFRNRWKWEISHATDAAVLALEKNDRRPLPAPEPPPEKSIVKLMPGSGKLFDAYPVSKKGDSFVQKRTLISRDGRIARITWGDVARITCPDKRRILEKLRENEPPEYAGDSERIPDDLIEALPFRSVTLLRRDVGESSVRKIGCNYFKAEQPNWGTAVYMNDKGKKAYYLVKNARVFGKTAPPGDCVKLLYVLRKGETVKFNYKKKPMSGRIYANFSNGNLKIDVGDGRFVMKSAKSCTPSGRGGL